jgi:hypothetical protein
LIRVSSIHLKLSKLSLDGDGKRFCCGEEKKPDSPTPGSDYTCPADNSPAVKPCEDDTTCKEFDLTCVTVDEANNKKFCCADKPSDKPTPVPSDDKQCPDGVPVEI